MRFAFCAMAVLALAACSSSPNSSSSGSTSGTSGTTSSSGSSGSTGAGSTTTGSSGTSGTTGFASAHDRCLQIAAAACQHDVSCGRLAAGDQALCVSGFNCDNSVTEALNDAQVDAGLATVDPAALASCLADINGAPCGETGSEAQRLSSSCADVSRGTGAGGSSCVASNDCAAQNSCVRGGTACGGTCQAWLTSGPCGLGYPPVDLGSYCDPNSNTVQPQVGQGQPCDAAGACTPPLLCAGLGASKTCQPLATATAGAPCEGTNTCAPGLLCVGARADAGGVCFAQGGSGASCAALRPDGGGFYLPDGGPRPDNALCLEGEFCDPSTLTCAPSSPLTGPCALDGGYPRCVEGACLAGSGGAGTCTFGPSGTACTRAGECQSGACVPVPDGGAICGDACP